MTAEAKNRLRTLRNHAERLGLMMIQRGDLVILTDATGTIVLSGPIEATEEYLSTRYTPLPYGPPPMAIPDAWAPWIEMLAAEMKAARRATGTIRLRRLCLARFARAHPHLDPMTTTRDDLLKYLGDDGWAPRYAHSVRTTFRVFFAMLRDQGHRDDDPAARLPDVATPRSVPRPCPDHAVAETFAATEDPAVCLALRVAVETGLRRGEIAQIRRSDVEGNRGAFWLRVTGKGGHVRTVPLSDELSAELLAGTGPYVFPSFDRWGNVIAPHMTPDQLGKLIAKALPDDWTAHTLRHRFATKAYAATRDIRAVQELLGHASPTTTAIYTQVANESLRHAAEAARMAPERGRQ
jgi:integrase/recombinase XerD